MIGKRLLAGFGALVLGATLAASGAHAGCSPAKAGPRGCKNEVLACRTLNGCADKATRRERRMCRRLCLTETVRACHGTATVCSASPSGAFVDSPVP